VAEISDAYMQEQLGRTREYAVVLLRASERYGREGATAVIRVSGPVSSPTGSTRCGASRATRSGRSRLGRTVGAQPVAGRV
jgi:hypothetical protein